MREKKKEVVEKENPLSTHFHSPPLLSSHPHTAYLFQRLGRAGYRQVMEDCTAVAQGLATALADSGFTIRSPRVPTPGVPLVAFSLGDDKRGQGFDEFDVADVLRERGWVVPRLPAGQGRRKHHRPARRVPRRLFAGAGCDSRPPRRRCRRQTRKTRQESGVRRARIGRVAGDGQQGARESARGGQGGGEDRGGEWGRLCGAPRQLMLKKWRESCGGGCTTRERAQTRQHNKTRTRKEKRDFKRESV